MIKLQTALLLYADSPRSASLLMGNCMNKYRNVCRCLLVVAVRLSASVFCCRLSECTACDSVGVVVRRTQKRRNAHLTRTLRHDARLCESHTHTHSLVGCAAVTKGVDVCRCRRRRAEPGWHTQTHGSIDAAAQCAWGTSAAGWSSRNRHCQHAKAQDEDRRLEHLRHARRMD